MEIRYIVRLLLKWLWLIVLVPALAGAGAYYVSTYKAVPIYEAKATMYIVNSTSDPERSSTAVYGEIASAQNAIRNYGEIVKSNSFINEALSALNLTGYSAERFSRNITLAFSERYSFVVGINVKDTDPKLASDMANKLCEIFVEKTDKLMQMQVIKVLDRAEVPSSPTNNKTNKNVGVAVMAGIIFCVILIFIVEYSQSVIIKDGKDVAKYLGLPVLAAIPSMKYIKTLK